MAYTLFDPFTQLRQFRTVGRPRIRGFRRFNADAEAERWTLPIDVAETDDGIVVTASAPGIKPEELEVTIEDNVLTIRGETAVAAETADERFLLRERRSGAFQRTVRIPESVNSEAATTRYEHGVLEVTLPKSEEKKPRRLTIAVPTAS